MTHKLIRRDQIPFNSIVPITRLFDDMVNTHFPELNKTLGTTTLASQAAYPKMDIIDQPDKVIIKATVPGHNKEDINITIEHDILTLEVKSAKDDTYNDTDYTVREIKMSHCTRSVKLSDNLIKDVNQMTASHENGILTIEIPKMEPEKTTIQKLEIK